MTSTSTDMACREWTLPQLIEQAAELLLTARVKVSDERISLTPDARTVRYYQSLGILARPVRYQGRSAIYGYRTLLQLVAVKLLQAQGHSLAQVQSSIAAASVSELEQAVLPNLNGESRAAETQASIRWETFEIAPGVLISIDPRRVTSPEATASLLATFLMNQGGFS